MHIKVYKNQNELNISKFLFRAGHLRYFLIFSMMKNDIFAFITKIIWLGVGLLNRTGTEICHR